MDKINRKNKLTMLILQLGWLIWQFFGISDCDEYSKWDDPMGYATKKEWK